MKEINNKPVIQASMSDLIEAIKMAMQRDNNGGVDKSSIPPSGKHYVYGLAGLSKLLQCSVATAQRIKSSGVLNDAILQPKNRRIMIIDADLALELIRENRRKK